MIEFENWKIDLQKGSQPIRQYDHLTRMLEVSGDLPAGYRWEMLVAKDGQLDIITLEPTESGCGALLTRDQLAVSGNCSLQLRGTQGEKVRHTNQITVYIPESLSGDAQWPKVPTEFTALEQRVHANADRAETAARTAQETAAGIHDISQQVDRVEKSCQAAEAAARTAQETAAGIQDVSDQAAQVRQSVEAAESARTRAEQAAGSAEKSRTQAAGASQAAGAAADRAEAARQAIADLSAAGIDGQFAVSDGRGGIRWETLVNRSEVGA